MPAHRKPKEARQDNRGNRSATVLPMHVVDQTPAEIPKIPAPRALKATKEVWENFWTSDLSQAVDLSTDFQRLARWITYVDEWHRAMKIYREERMVEGSMGQVRVNPIWKTVSEIEGHLKAAESELGLTPLARSRLGIEFGRAQLTAAELNRLAEHAQEDDDEEGRTGEFAEWEDAAEA